MPLPEGVLSWLQFPQHRATVIFYFILFYLQQGINDFYIPTICSILWGTSHLLHSKYDRRLALWGTGQRAIDSEVSSCKSPLQMLWGEKTSHFIKQARCLMWNPTREDKANVWVLYTFFFFCTFVACMCEEGRWRSPPTNWRSELSALTASGEQRTVT